MNLGFRIPPGLSLASITAYPADRGALARQIPDVLATGLAAATAVPAVTHGNPHPDGTVILVVALSALPLLGRRAWPVPVFGCVLAVSFGIGLWTDFHVINGAAVLVSLYTVAATRPLREMLACATVLVMAIAAATIKVVGGDWWYEAIFVCVVYSAALGLGLYQATRRAYLIELHDHAARLERERDQQGALAAAAERARIAREMHDIVAHNLTVMITLSEAARAAIATSPERAAEVMGNVSVTGRRALADTRGMLGVLRQDPSQPPHADLQPTPGLANINALIEQVRAVGLDTSLEISGEQPDLPEGVQLTVYRLVQEALTNTLKHAGDGAHAWVRLRFLARELRVEVEDDGVGPLRPAAAGPGSGLLGMRERVRAYGGEVLAGSRVPRGWRVSARLHLDAA